VAKSKFARGNGQVKSFHDFLDNCESCFGHETNKCDRAADDEYLKKIRQNRGPVKQLGINNPMTKSAIDYRVQMAVGTSVRIKPNAMWERLGWTEEQNRIFRRTAKELWKMHMEADERWSDAAGLHTISEQAAQHTRIFENEGESMAAVYELGSARRSPLSFNIGNIDPDRVRDPSNLSPETQRRVSDGKLVSRRGYPLGFYVHAHHRRSSKSDGNEDYQFIPTRNRDTGREQFIHSYVQCTSDLSRGISALASCLTLECQKEEYVNAALEDAISKAGVTFVIKSSSKNYESLMDLLGDTEGDDSPLTSMMRA